MLKEIKGKRILITGGTGFLGRALTRELLKHNPQSIRIYSRDEFKHYRMNQDFGFPYNKGPLRHFIGDVRDYDRLNKAMKGCDIVVHAAALKRIDMIEYNVDEAIKTNVQGSMNVMRACIENNVKKGIFISTDKACSPINTYGASKFIAERIFVEGNYSRGKSETRLSCVRYGNVVNSTGSVIPFFLEKIMKGETLSVTDDKMTRFLITEEQAVNLILKAIVHGEGGEIFVPKLPSAKIVDLAKALCNLNNVPFKHQVTGIRPGEKLHEMMINEAESKRAQEFGDGFVITSEVEKYTGIKNKFWNKGKRMENDSYNSKDALISGEELEKYLKKLDLNNKK
ncbi:UDP-N-acetylglucosamine 4,6-dehydratase (inverting) [Candidatus Pacearchaeota archaeon CG10_big_fil_rev_8_21_14_0_10_32_42]|nr:MAG: UDP-N-acetylglucosamine 4,6-dehydratase (inverting) [Candidatus Pacearchaeota archaeon CG10_big_fil_rev_8_21_14_0_10_32_42]